MGRHSRLLVAAAFALAFAAGGAHAQTSGRHPHPHARIAARAGDVVVHTGRSYLDPGTSAAVGTEDRYFSDTERYSFTQVGPSFSDNTAGFERLPTRFNPPGQTEPLFRF